MTILLEGEKASDLDERGVRALAAAVVLSAIRSARKGDTLASAWLMGTGWFWMSCLGLHLSEAWLREWIRAGLPGSDFNLFDAHQRGDKRRRARVRSSS